MEDLSILPVFADLVTTGEFGPLKAENKKNPRFIQMLYVREIRVVQLPVA